MQVTILHTEKPNIVKTSHTPGPWKIEHDHNRFDSSFDTLAIVEGKEDGRIVLAHLNVRAFAPHLEEPQANARLIAAAPELLEALRKALLWTDAEHDVGDWRSIAEATIAKATQP